MREVTVLAVSELPVAAPMSAGARLMKSELRSGPAGRCCCGGGVGLGRRTGGGSVVPDRSSWPLPWSQQKESLEQELVPATILEGAAHSSNMTLGIHTPGHTVTLGGGGGRRGGWAWGRGRPGLGLGGRLLDLVKQQRPFPGHTALRSISSQSSEKKPVTQVPWHRSSGGISGLRIFCFSSFSSFFSSFLFVSFSFSLFFFSFLSFTT